MLLKWKSYVLIQNVTCTNVMIVKKWSLRIKYFVISTGVFTNGHVLWFRFNIFDF